MGAMSIDMDVTLNISVTIPASRVQEVATLVSRFENDLKAHANDEAARQAVVENARSGVALQAGGPFGEAVNRFMTEHNLATVTEFAEAIGLGKATVYNLLRGRDTVIGSRVKPNAVTLARLARVLKLEEDEILRMLGHEVQEPAPQPENEPAQEAAAAAAESPASKPEPATRAAPVVTEPAAPRYCEVCGAELTRKRYAAGSMESHKAFARRTTCDKKCGAAKRFGRTIPEIPAVPEESLGPLCEQHGERIGPFGCTSCNAHNRYRTEAAKRAIRPVNHGTAPQGVLR